MIFYMPCCLSESAEDYIGEDGIDISAVIVLYFLNLQHVILCLKNFITEINEKLAFQLSCTFPSLRILKGSFRQTRKNNTRII